MASKRHLRRKMCDGKKQFDDQKTAGAAAFLRQREHGQQLNAYHCQFCGRYHIGHPPRKVRQAINARRNEKWT